MYHTLTCTKIIGEVGGLGFLVAPIEGGDVLRGSASVVRICGRHDGVGCGGQDAASIICLRIPVSVCISVLGTG